MRLPFLESSARDEARRILRTLDFAGVDDTSDLVDYIEMRLNAPIAIKTLPESFPAHVTGLITLKDQGGATIYLPREAGVYPAHVLHHEIGHLLLWETALQQGQDVATTSLDCSDDYVEAVAEEIAKKLSARFLRVRTPRIEQILG